MLLKLYLYKEMEFFFHTPVKSSYVTYLMSTFHRDYCVNFALLKDETKITRKVKKKKN